MVHAVVLFSDPTTPARSCAGALLSCWLQLVVRLQVTTGAERAFHRVESGGGDRSAGTSRGD